jgi:hypothetical protein
MIKILFIAGNLRVMIFSNSSSQSRYDWPSHLEASWQSRTDVPL